MTREPISRRLRFAVFERDGFRCRYCGRGADDAVLHADHRTPVVDGGPTTLENLVTACSVCNLGKSDFRPIKFIPCQRQQAIAADLFQRVIERFHAGLDPFEAWDVIYNTCMAEESGIEYLLRIILDAPDWPTARREIWQFGGFPIMDEVGDVI